MKFKYKSCDLVCMLLSSNHALQQPFALSVTLLRILSSEQDTHCTRHVQKKSKPYSSLSEIIQGQVYTATPCIAIERDSHTSSLRNCKQRDHTHKLHSRTPVYPQVYEIASPPVAAYTTVDGDNPLDTVTYISYHRKTSATDTFRCGR